MTTKKKTPEEENNERLRKRVDEIWDMVSNKQKREAIKFFDQSLEDFDNLDTTVFIAWVAAGGTKSLEELDAMPQGKLDAVILGEE